MSRIYTVTHKATGTARLIAAPNPAQALRYVTRDEFDVRPSSPMTVAELMKAGVQLEHPQTSTESQPQTEPQPEGY